MVFGLRFREAVLRQPTVATTGTPERVVRPGPGGEPLDWHPDRRKP